MGLGVQPGDGPPMPEEALAAPSDADVHEPSSTEPPPRGKEFSLVPSLTRPGEDIAALPDGHAEEPAAGSEGPSPSESEEGKNNFHCFCVFLLFFIVSHYFVCFPLFFLVCLYAS